MIKKLIIVLFLFTPAAFFAQVVSSQMTANVTNVTGLTFDVTFTATEVLTGIGSAAGVYVKIPDAQAPGISVSISGGNPYSLAPQAAFSTGGFTYFGFTNTVNLDLGGLFQVGTPVVMGTFMVMGGNPGMVLLTAGDFAPIEPAPGQFAWFGSHLTTDGTSTNLVSDVSLNALPITLLHFDAQKGDAQVELMWQTVEELNSSHFDLERSVDASNWTKIAEIEAYGESHELQDYGYTDRDINHLITDQTIIYYRLNMVDADGASKYSPIRSVHFDKKEADDIRIVLYPNPTNDQISIVTGLLEFDELLLVNLEGKIIYRNRYENKLNNVIINVRELSLKAGQYFIKINSDDDTQNIVPFIYVN